MPHSHFSSVPKLSKRRTSKGALEKGSNKQLNFRNFLEVEHDICHGLSLPFHHKYKHNKKKTFISPQDMGSSILLLQSERASQTLLSGIHWSEFPHWNSPSLQCFVGSATIIENIHELLAIIHVLETKFLNSLPWMTI